jgi:PAS domain S-box-containing protein
MATVGPAPALLLERLFADARVGVAFVDAELRYVQLNDALAEMNGVPAPEHLGRTVQEVLGPSGEAVAELLRGCLASGEPIQNLEMSVPGEAGDRAFVATFQPYHEDGQALGILAVVQDVSEPRRALAESESRFRSLFEANIVAVLIADDERVLEANDAFLQMVGHTREELAAGELDWRRMTPAEHADADAAAMEHLRSEGVAEPWEKEYFRKDGTRVPVLIGCATLGTEPFRAVCFALDLTERRRSLERVTRLHRLASALSAALSADEVAAAILEHGMAATGATCGVLGLRDGEELVIGHRHRFGDVDQAPTRLALGAPVPMPEAMRRGEPVLLGARAEWLARYPVAPRGDFEAFAAVPLAGERGPVGCMGLGFPHARRFETADVELLQVVARQGAQALERAALYEQRSHVARTLQRGLLPNQLPWIPGLEIASAYEPMGAGD